MGVKAEVEDRANRLLRLELAGQSYEKIIEVSSERSRSLKYCYRFTIMTSCCRAAVSDLGHYSPCRHCHIENKSSPFTDRYCFSVERTATSI